VDLYLSGIHQLMRFAAPLTSGKLLDVGCGRKPYEHFFRPYVSEYIGIENEATLSTTVDSASGAADHYYDGNILPFEDSFFDTVISVSVLEHTPTPHLLFKEMSRVLKPGGKMIAHVPFSFRLHEEPHDYYRFTCHALRSLCAANDLSVKDVVAQGTLWTVIGHKLTTYLAFRIGRMGQVAQSLNKLGMEEKQTQGSRLWTLPFVVPAIFIIVIIVRLLERFFPTTEDCLAFMLIAEKN
jgi:SAM-dependent methyltransferase